MKHIGIVGITAEGSALSYRLIVKKAAALFGTPTKHPEITIHNFSFYDYFNLGPTAEDGWSRVHDMILLSIKKLKMIGADFIIIPANTVHHEFEYLESRSPLPIINMINIVVNECDRMTSKKVGLLGTHLTMTNNLYQHKLKERGILTVIPNEKNCQLVNSIIANDLLTGRASQKHTEILSDIIKNLDCDSVILACTELPLVIESKNVSIPIINTTKLLAEAALQRAIS